MQSKSPESENPSAKGHELEERGYPYADQEEQGCCPTRRMRERRKWRTSSGCVG